MKTTDGVIPVYEQQDIFAHLWQEIIEKHLRPEDDYEIAALLESFGWTDNRAREELGVSDVFQLAKELGKFSAYPIEITVNQYKVRAPFSPIIKDIMKQFLRGMVFALPMVISIASMLTLRFSLWSYQYLSTRTATAIALGTLLSFITVGGFMQAMARQGYFYMFQGHYQLMRKMTFRIIILGVFLSLLISIIGIILNVAFPELPYDMLGVSLVYYIVLSAIWLSVAVLYILRRELWFTAILSSGIGMVYVGFRVLHMNILTAQILSLGVLIVSSLILLRYFFSRVENALDKGINAQLPRFSVTAYSVAPYFAYGLLYFTLLFLDRVMAWSSNSASVPFVIWFRGDYELGLDFALLALTVPMGISEVIVSRLMARIWSTQKDFLAKESLRMNAMFTRIYHRSVLLMVIISVVNGFFVYVTVKWIISKNLQFIQGRIRIDGVTNEVFIVGLIAYSILSIGLLHAVVMFSMSRPDLVVKPMLASVAVDFFVGFLLTRWISYPQAVWGLLAGCLCFSYFTSKNVNKVLLELDYHMYFLS